MRRLVITSEKLPHPVGPFSLAVRGGGLMFLSGQVAQHPSTGRLVDGDVARQTDQILRNLATALEAAGRGLGDVLRVGVYLINMSDFGVMNDVYGTYFAEPYPARTTVGVAALPLGAAVEIDAVVV